MTDNQPTAKVCTKCHTLKLLEEFQKRKNGRYGRNAQCKMCISEISRLRYRENPEVREQVKADVKKWREANPEKAREHYNQWVDADPEAAAAARAKHRAERDTAAK